MKTLLTFAATHALVFTGAVAFTAAPFRADSIFGALFAASLLALGWLELSRRVEPLRTRADVVRPYRVDRSSRVPTVHARRAA